MKSGNKNNKSLKDLKEAKIGNNNDGDENDIPKKIGKYKINQDLNIKKLEEYISEIQEFHRFAVKNKMKFLTYLLEMICMETVNVKLRARSKNQCAPANQKAPYY